MNDTPIFFDMDRKVLVSSRDVSRPLPDDEIPWFSTRYPVKVTLQAVSKGYPAIVGQQPIKVSLTRGTTKYCDLWAISGANPWFVVPSLAVTPGPLRIELRDGLDNVILQFDTMCIDSVPENPAEIPTIFSNPTSVRVRDEGERVIRQPMNRTIRLQRDASLFLVDDINDGVSSWTIRLDFGSLCLDHYYSCNRILVKAPGALSVSCGDALLNTDSLPQGWTEGRVTVLPDSTTKIDFTI